jgi:hypothetical protein
MSKLATALMALVLITTAPLGGCAAVFPIVTAVASVIAEIVGKVDRVESHIRALSDEGVLPADVADKAQVVRAILDQLHDAARQSPQAYAALVAEFEKRWAELVAAAGRFGVRAGPADERLAATPGGVTVHVPPAGELGARLRAEGPR